MTEERYSSEDVLQQLLENYPNLLAGDQFPGEEPRRWLLVSREAGVASEEGGSARKLDQIDRHHSFSLCRLAPVRATVGP
jgi:hypothetical protein